MAEIPNPSDKPDHPGAISRRAALAGLAACGLGLTRPLPAVASHPEPGEKIKQPSAAEVLARLKEGNQRFSEGKPKHDHTSKEWRRGLVASQHPFAVIVGCSDSRVPVELVFDQGFGDLFVIRNAGNLIATDVLGSIEYAVFHLQVPLVLVLGHEGCGAVTAALKARDEQDKEPLELQAILRMIDVGLSDHRLQGTEGQKLAAAIEWNVRWGVKQMKYLAAERHHPTLSRVQTVGAVYELSSGKVRFLV